MSDDIVDRLGDTLTRTVYSSVDGSNIRDARAEIVRLRAEVERLTEYGPKFIAMYENWTTVRALADQLAEALLSGPFRGDRRERMYGSDWVAVHEALDAYEQHKEGQ